jgi:hypothetical protein
MGTPLQSVLQVRYMDSSTVVGTKSYGGGDTNNEDCIDIEKQEAPLVSETIDASRSHIVYFDTGSHLGGDLDGMTGTVETSNINKQAINRAANFLNTAYALIGDRVYEYVQESGLWTTSTTLTAKTTTATSSIGLYPVFVNNIPFLVTAWSTGGNNWRYAKLNGNTNTWTISANISGPSIPTDSLGGVLTEHQHRNRIYFVGDSTTQIGFYDFENDSFGFITWSSTVRHPMDFCTFGRDLYCLNKDASNNVNIHRIDLTSTTIVSTFDRTSQTSPTPDAGSALTTTNNFEGRALLFVDNIFDSGNPTMYADYVVNGGRDIGQFPATETNHGVTSEQYGHNSDGSLLNRTSAGGGAGAFQANPFKMMQNQASTGDDSDIRKGEGLILRCFVDQKNRDVDLSDITNISASSRYSVDCQTGNGGGGDFGNLHYWKFTGSGTAPLHLEIIKPDGQQASFGWLGTPTQQIRHRAVVHEKIGGGGRYYELNGSDEKLPNIVFRGFTTTNQDGVVRINYTLQTSASAPSGTNVTVRWFWDDNMHSPERICTFVGTSDGTNSGILIADLPIEDKEYFVDWDARSDGATRNVRINVNGQVSTAVSASTAISDPTELGGLTLWLEANDTTTITSGVGLDVSGWEDKSTASLISGVFQPTAASRPNYVFNSNNGNGGIEFIRASGHFLFASGAAIGTAAMTTIVIYNPAQTAPKKTMVSFSNDETFFTDGPGLGPQYSDADHHTMSTSGEFLVTETQDNAHRIIPSAARTLAIPSGSSTDANIIIWRDISFNTRLKLHPGGVADTGIYEVGNSVKPSGLSNTTVGRFSGAINSGIYPLAGDYFSGIVYEVATYNRELFDIEIERFIKYAEAKYTLIL